VRVALTHDAAGIADIYAPVVEHTAIPFEVHPPSDDEIARRITVTLEHWPWLVADDGGAVLGYAYAAQHRTRAAYRWSVDVSVYVAAHARRSGVARRLYGALFTLLNRQGFYAAFAGITLPNAPSLELHRAVGFEPVGIYRNVGYKHGACHDVSCWQRTLLQPARLREARGTGTFGLAEPARLRAGLGRLARYPAALIERVFGAEPFRPFVFTHGRDTALRRG
jgi:L-amino acid N-acyltransferase YncA